MIEQIILLCLIVIMIAGSYITWSDITELYNKIKSQVIEIISYFPKDLMTTILLVVGILALAVITSLNV